jgi:catechol-2,3-dioxygenase
MTLKNTHEGAAFLAFGDYHHHLGLNTWRSSGGGPSAPESTGLLGRMSPFIRKGTWSHVAFHTEGDESRHAEKPSSGARASSRTPEVSDLDGLTEQSALPCRRALPEPRHK